MCLYPKLIENRKYKATKKNGGIIPAITDKRTLLVPVGCTKCIECKKQKARNWQVRLQEDLREHKNAKMITLTFSNDAIKELSADIHNLNGYELDNEIAKRAIKKFRERWRRKYGKSIRHWLVTELGHNGTENIHLHGLIWTDEPNNNITERWSYGYVHYGTFVNEKTINYIIKYIHKTDLKHKEYNPRVLTSAGIGGNYIKRLDSKRNKYNGNNTIELYKNRQGYTMAMPTYWRNQIYNEKEREQLWLKKLDENVRYVLGQKICIEKEEETYYEVLDEARQKNTRLGYGNDAINWERRRYENQRRNINFIARITARNK